MSISASMGWKMMFRVEEYHSLIRKGDDAEEAHEGQNVTTAGDDELRQVATSMPHGDRKQIQKNDSFDECGRSINQTQGMG